MSVFWINHCYPSIAHSSNNSEYSRVCYNKPKENNLKIHWHCLGSAQPKHLLSDSIETLIDLKSSFHYHFVNYNICVEFLIILELCFKQFKLLWSLKNSSHLSLDLLNCYNKYAKFIFILICLGEKPTRIVLTGSHFPERYCLSLEPLRTTI